MSDERSADIVLELRVGSGFEVLAGAVAFARGDPGPGWTGRLEGGAATSVEASLAAEVGDPTGEVWLHVLAAATDLPGQPDAAAISNWLRGADPRHLRRVVIGADVPAWREVVDPAVLAAAAAAEPAAVEQVLSDPRHYAGRAAAALAVLGPLDAAETRRRLLAAFDAMRTALPEGLEEELWAAQLAFVRDRLPGVAPVGDAVARDAAVDQNTQSTDRSTQSTDQTGNPLAVLDEAAGGFEWTPEPGINRLVVLPQLALSPALLLLQHGDARVVGVPVAATDEAAQLAAAYAAAGDEQRLLILRLLAHEQLGVSEVARRLGIAKSTAHHHLGALRRAGLIRLVGQAWRYAYRTNNHAPDALAARLRLLLSTPPDKEIT